jgi:hypothetical protein
MTSASSATPLFNEVREACQWVADRAQWVQIRRDRIAPFLQALPLERAGNPPLDPDCHHLGHGEETVAFFLTLETVNFGSGFFPYIEEGRAHDGYFIIAGALAQHFRQYGPIPAAELAKLSTQDCAALFRQDIQKAPVLRLMELFALALNQLGAYLLQSFDGQFGRMLRAAEHSAERLARLLLQMPCFQDIAPYQGRSIPFLKRVQITAADLSLAFHSQGPGYFYDLGQLTSFADNMIPHVLRCEGLLEYHPWLAAQIDSGQRLEAGSPEEVEIRACALHTVELLQQALARHGRLLRPMDLDYLIWNLGQEAAYEGGKRIHLTRTWFY